MAGKDHIKSFKRTFLTGLAALFPILLTVFLLTWLYGILNNTVGRGVNAACRAMLCSSPSLFDALFPGAPPNVVADKIGRLAYAQDHFPEFVGVVVGIIGVLVAIYLMGVALRGYVGAQAVKLVDGFFERFPGIKVIYPHARQFADLMFGPHSGEQFRQVVAIQYPRRGVYTIGFLTGRGFEGVNQKTEKDLMTIFVPHSPTPLTGFIVLVPRDEVIMLDMTVEEAFRYFMTVGLIAPEKALAKAGVEAGTREQGPASAPTGKEVAANSDLASAAGDKRR